MYILYYSGYCIQSQKLLRVLSCAPQDMKNKIHFVCIDSRKTDPATGKTTIYLDNGATLILPPNITRVPALILITKGNRVIFGTDEIIDFLKSAEMKPASLFDSISASTTTGGGGGGGGGVAPANQCKNTSFAPSKDDLVCHDFSTTKYSLAGVESDKFSFYSDSAGTINTPAEDYSRIKMEGDITLEKLVAKRNADLPMGNGTAPMVVGASNMPSFTPALPQMPTY